MDFNQIMKELRSGVYHPIYFLHGEEPFYIDEIDRFIAKNALSEDQQGFNQTVLYGLDTDVSTIVSEAKRFPMMSDRQVVIVREAYKVRNLLGGDDKTNELLAYLKNPLSSTVLVICHKYKKVDARKKVGKAVLAQSAKHGVVFKSEKLKDYLLPDWIVKHIQKDGHTIDPRTATIIAEHLGNDMGRIHSELNKLYIGIPSKCTITAQMVEDRIGVSKDYNVFEFQDAIGKKNREKAMRIAIRFGHDVKSHPIQAILPVLYSYFAKVMKFQYCVSRSMSSGELARVCGINPYFMKDYQAVSSNYSQQAMKNALSYIREADLHSKGYGNARTDQADILKELTVKLML